MSTERKISWEELAIPEVWHGKYLEIDSEILYVAPICEISAHKDIVFVRMDWIATQGPDRRWYQAHWPLFTRNFKIPRNLGSTIDPYRNEEGLITFGVPYGDGYIKCKVIPAERYKEIDPEKLIGPWGYPEFDKTFYTVDGSPMFM